MRAMRLRSKKVSRNWNFYFHFPRLKKTFLHNFKNNEKTSEKPIAESSSANKNNNNGGGGGYGSYFGGDS